MYYQFFFLVANPKPGIVIKTLSFLMEFPPDLSLLKKILISTNVLCETDISIISSLGEINEYGVIR
jgi:hypothetical protein